MYPEIFKWSGQLFSGLMPFGMGSLELMPMDMGPFSKLMPIGMGSGWPSLYLLAWVTTRVRSIWSNLSSKKVVRVTSIPKLTPFFVLFTQGEARGSKLQCGITSLVIDADRVIIFAQFKFGARSQPKRLSVDSSTVQAKMMVEVTVDDTQ